MRSGKLLPLMGLGAAAATTVVGVVPVTAGAVSDGSNERVIDLASTASPANGELESCSAYFGFGKVDMITFDVELESGEATGPLPSVGDGIDVVLVMTLNDDSELRCVPVEVTEDVWDTFWEENPVPVADVTGPAFPGPGRYFFPAVNLDQEIDGAVVTNVSFEVANVPAPYSLVSPTSAQSLPAIVSVDSIGGILENVGKLTPGFYAYIELQASTAAADALVAALAACGASESPVSSADLDAAWQAVKALAPDLELPDEFTCDVAGGLTWLTPNAEALAAAGQIATIAIAAPSTPPGPPGPPAPPGPESPESPSAEVAEALAIPRFTG
jgi:hypothetical protein